MARVYLKVLMNMIVK